MVHRQFAQAGFVIASLASDDALLTEALPLAMAFGVLRCYLWCLYLLLIFSWERASS